MGGFRDNISDREWDLYKAAQRSRREARLPIRRKQILNLQRKGYRVVQITPYQYRINGQVDLYPVHNRYHNISTGKRGGYPDADQFIDRFFGRRK